MVGKGGDKRFSPPEHRDSIYITIYIIYIYVTLLHSSWRRCSLTARPCLQGALWEAEYWIVVQPFAPCRLRGASASVLIRTKREFHQQRTPIPHHPHQPTPFFSIAETLAVASEPDGRLEELLSTSPSRNLCRSASGYVCGHSGTPFRPDNSVRVSCLARHQIKVKARFANDDPLEKIVKFWFVNDWYQERFRLGKHFPHLNSLGLRTQI